MSSKKPEFITNKESKTSPKRHLSEALGNIALIMRERKSKHNHILNRYGDRRPNFAGALESQIRKSREEKQAEVNVRLENNPNDERERRYSEILSFVGRAEELFSKGDNRINMINGDKTVTQVKVHELSPDSLPGWVKESINNNLTDEPIKVQLSRSVSMTPGGPDGVYFGEPAYELVASSWEVGESGLGRGAQYSFKFDSRRQDAESNVMIGDPNKVVHGKHVGLAGPQVFNKPVTTSQISELL